MELSWLFHRLGKARASAMGNPFTFGASGWVLSEEATKLLTPIFSFDYMMAAEYEGNAVPNALHRIAKDAESFVGFRMEFPQREVAKHWREEVRYRTKGGRPRKTDPKPDPVFPDPAKLYMFCHKDERVTVESIVAQLVSNRFRARDDTFLHCALRPQDESDNKIGWLELNNGYFIFVDKEAWKKTVNLFKGEGNADVRQVDDSDISAIQDGDRTDVPPLRSGKVRGGMGGGKSRRRVRDQQPPSEVSATPPIEGGPGDQVLPQRKA